MRHFILSLTLLLTSIQLFGQSSLPDTSAFPYWIEMMQDRTVNLHQTQRAFETYWQSRPIEKGSGFKPFKRWEYMAEREADANGDLPPYQDLYSAIYRYYDSLSGNNLQLNFGGAPCLTTGNWVEIGPQKIPGNRTSQPNGMGRVNALAFHPSDSSIIWAGAPAGGLWKSTDKGISWTCNTDTLPTLGISAIAIHTKNPDIIYIGTGDRDASDAASRGVMKSSDGGNSWKWANNTMGNANVAKLIIDPIRPDTLIAATSSGIFRTVNGGNTWTLAQGGGFFKDLVFKPGTTDTAYATRNGLFYRSINNGISWTQITSGLPTGTARGAIAVTKANPDFVYFVLTNSSTFNSQCLSIDGGSTFVVKSTTPNIMDYSNNGSGTGGQAWYDLDMAADPYNAAVIYVAGVNIFKSTDSGTTWKINAHWVGTGAPSVHADHHVLEYSESGFGLFSGNDGGVYETFNGGTNWKDISQDLGIAQIYRLSQSATQKDMLINGYQDNGTGLMENSKWFTVMGGDGMDCAINPQNSTWAYSDLYYGDVRRYKNGFFDGKIAANGSNGINESGGWVTSFILQEGTPTTMFIGYKNIWRSTNVTAASAASVSWTKISNNLAGSNSQNIVYIENSPADPNVLYFSRGDAKFFKSSDVNSAAPTWTDLTAQLPSTGNVVWIECHPTLVNRIYMIQGNQIYQSNNGGNTWMNISGGLPSITKLSMVFDTSSKKQGMYLGTYMGVFYKDTTMSGWAWYNTGMPVNTRVTDLDIFYHPDGRSKSHVVSATYGRGNWRSPLYDEDKKIPIAGFNADILKVCAGQTIQLTDTSSNLPTKWYWSVRPSTFNWVSGSDSNARNPQIQFTQKGNYSIKYYVENCAGVDSIEKTAYISVEDPIVPAGCVIKTINTGNFGMGIYNVAVDSFSYSDQGTFQEGGYLDMACSKIFSLKNDTTYNLSVKTGINYVENVKVYIDFNNNGSLKDAGEMVFNTKKQMTFHSGSIAIPGSAVTGKILRMRVMGDYDTVLHACDTLQYGQAQDFGVVLIPRLPEPNFIASTSKICDGMTVTYTDSSKGSITHYKWNFGTGAIPDTAIGKGPHLIRYKGAGYKTATLTLNFGAIGLTKDSILEVISKPNLQLTKTVGLDTFCEGPAFELKAIDSSYVPTTIQWIKNGLPFIPTVDTLFKKSISGFADSGSYQITKTYNGCSDTSAFIQMAIYAVPNIAPQVLKDTQCLKNNGFTFSANASIARGSMGHTWDFDDGSFSSTANPNHIFTDIGTFMVKYRAASLFCAKEDSFPVVIIPSPTALFNISDSDQCFRGNLFQFNSQTIAGSGPLFLNWKFGDGNGDTATKPAYTYSNAGKFQVRLIASGFYNCADTISKQIEVFHQPTSIANFNDTQFCLKGNKFIHSSLSTVNATWGAAIVQSNWNYGNGQTATGGSPADFSYPAAGTYLLKLGVLTNQGCTDTSTAIIHIYSDPKAGYSINDSIQCEKGHEFVFGRNASADVISHIFNFNKTAAELPSGSGRYTFADTGNIQVTMIVLNATSCSDTLIGNIRILSKPKIDFSANTVCLGETTQFTNLSQTGTYQWHFGDGQTSALTNPTHTYSKADSFDVSLEVSANGCSDTLLKIKSAAVHPVPIAAFSAVLNQPLPLITQIQLNNQSLLSDQYFWNLDRFGSSVLTNPEFDVTDTATFRVILIASNRYNCHDTTFRDFVVIPDEKVFIPEVFTPNADNLNEIFKPFGVRFFSEYRFVIYNRWGEKVFESDQPAKGWDGTYKGLPATPGVYVYLLELVDSRNRRISEKGTVQLLR
jgi:gliding motility-associated-like protein